MSLKNEVHCYLTEHGATHRDAVVKKFKKIEPKKVTTALSNLCNRKQLKREDKIYISIQEPQDYTGIVHPDCTFDLQAKSHVISDSKTDQVEIDAVGVVGKLQHNEKVLQKLVSEMRLLIADRLAQLKN